MKILVLSDIHYPRTNIEELRDIIRKERPERTIFLGDSVYNVGYVEEFVKLVQTVLSTGEYVLVSGDSDSTIPVQSVSSLDLDLDGRKFIFIHGHQFNVWSEKITKKMAYFLKKFDKDLPSLAYATYSRIKLRNFHSYLILGHSHALKYFPRLKVACSGCLTTEKNVYSDRGYIVISAENDGLSLSVIGLGESKKESIFRLNN